MRYRPVRLADVPDFVPLLTVLNLPWLVYDEVKKDVVTAHATERQATDQAYALNYDLPESQYHKQRSEATVHPNRKDRKKAYHDPTKPYQEVASDIDAALTRWKAQNQ